MTPLSFAALALALLGVILLARPRRFYFIRHGETVLNAKRIKQGEEGELSEKGRRQAAQVALTLKDFPVEQIISSTYPRAKETAEILKQFLHVPVAYSALFAERKNPSEVIGKPVHSPEVQQIVDQMDLAYHDDDYRFSDEENFVDIKKRARIALNLLARQGAPHTVIVTHHAFLKMIVAYLLYRERLHAGDFAKLAFFNTSDNAGITVLEFNPLSLFSPTRGWSVISYNEQPG